MGFEGIWKASGECRLGFGREASWLHRASVEGFGIPIRVIPRFRILDRTSNPKP